MNKLQILSIPSDDRIESWELCAFCGAAAGKAGWEHLLFVHCNNTPGGLLP